MRSVPFITISFSEVTKRVGVTNRVGTTTNLTRFVARVTNRVGVIDRVATGFFLSVAIVYSTFRDLKLSLTSKRTLNTTL